jgi:beta-hydroxylase
MDVLRPSPLPGVLSTALAVISAGVDRINAVFYKNWKVIGSRKKAAGSAS